MSRTGSKGAARHGCASNRDAHRKLGGARGKAVAGWRRRELGGSGPTGSCPRCGSGLRGQRRCPTCGARL